MNKQRRQQLIKEIIEQQPVSSQQELLEALSKKGVTTTQATVSRDLNEIGVQKRKTSRGYIYDYNSIRLAAKNELRHLFNQFVLSVQRSANLILLKTAPAAAQTVAAALDSQKLEGVLGTVAGDDTVLVVVENKASTARKLENYLYSLTKVIF